MTVKIGDESRTATVKVDSSKTPRTIDIMPDEGPDKGRVMKGIYEVKDDELRLCGAEAGKDRPTEPSAKEGSGLALMTFKRVKK